MQMEKVFKSLLKLIFNINYAKRFAFLYLNIIIWTIKQNESNSKGLSLLYYIGRWFVCPFWHLTKPNMSSCSSMKIICKTFRIVQWIHILFHYSSHKQMASPWKNEYVLAYVGILCEEIEAIIAYFHVILLRLLVQGCSC